MAIKTIITEPNKILRQKSLPVKQVGVEEQRLMDDMLETMYDANGIGLAAIQIGVPKRIIVMDISKSGEKNNPMYFVNPLIKDKVDATSTYEEGCLSVPNFFAEVNRPKECNVEYLDYEGKKKMIVPILACVAKNLVISVLSERSLACFQHQVTGCDWTKN